MINNSKKSTSPSSDKPKIRVGETYAKDLALSSLQCPSPPPILNNNITTGKNVSSNSINDIIHGEICGESCDKANNSDGSENGGENVAKSTVPAGGVLLRSRAAATAVVAAVAAATARDKIRDGQSSIQSPTVVYNERNFSNSSLSSQSQDLNLQHQQHLKSPDIHAHFYVEDTIRHGGNAGLRSRSNSNTTVDSNLQKMRDIDELVLNSPAKSVSPSSAHANGNSDSLPTTNIIKKENNSNIDPRLPQDDGKLHILFGACGSMGISKIKLIIKKLEEIYGDKVSIQVILTPAAENFIPKEVKSEVLQNIIIWRDAEEWKLWKTRTDPVLHIELRRWADILIIAPLTANTLAKIALGLCDNLLTNVIRAWNTAYPILLAPSMASYAYNSPATKRHLKTINEEMKWIEVLKPVEKIIGSYGDIGMGGMMDYNEIVDKIVHKLGGYPEEDDEDDEEAKGGDDDDDDDEDDDDEDDDDEEEDDTVLDDDDDDEHEDEKERERQNNIQSKEEIANKMSSIQLS